MVITGSSILSTFSLINILLPLWPLWILLVRTERAPWANWLLVLCIYISCSNLLPLLPPVQRHLPAFSPLIELAEFTIQFYLLRQLVAQAKAKDIMQLLLVAFLSSVVTLYWQQGTAVYQRQMAFTEAGLLVFLSFVALVQLTMQRHIVIFRSPVFWIACGILIFYSMKILIECLAAALPASPLIQQQKLLLATISNSIRLIAFTAAISVRSSSYLQLFK